jgi:hypothetical protein
MAAFDIELRDNGATSFDIALSTAVAITEKAMTFIGNIFYYVEGSSNEAACTFVE